MNGSMDTVKTNLVCRKIQWPIIKWNICGILWKCVKDVLPSDNSIMGEQTKGSKHLKN